VDKMEPWEKEHYWKHKAVKGKVTGLLNDIERQRSSSLVAKNKKLKQQQKERWMKQHMASVQRHQDQGPEVDAESASNDNSGSSSGCSGTGAEDASTHGSVGLSSMPSCSNLSVGAVGVRGLVRGKRSQALLRLLCRFRQRHVGEVLEMHRQEQLRWKALQGGGGQTFTIEEARKVVRRSSDAACILQMIQGKIDAACNMEDDEDDSEMEDIVEEEEEEDDDSMQRGSRTVSPTFGDLMNEVGEDKQQREVEREEREQRRKAMKLRRQQQLRRKKKKQEKQKELKLKCPPLAIYSVLRKTFSANAVTSTRNSKGSKVNHNKTEDRPAVTDDFVTNSIIDLCMLSSRSKLMR